jgi:plasmid maintenance system antidote protein VapI
MIPQIEYQTTGVSQQPHGLNQSGRMRWLAEHATPNGSPATNWPGVANTLGIDASKFRLYLAGTARITKHDAAAIADYFNVDLNWLRLDDPGSSHRLNRGIGLRCDTAPVAAIIDAKTQAEKLEAAKRRHEESVGHVKSWNQYAVELGISNSLISVYRRCIRRISKPHAHLLAKVFDVSAEWLRDTDERMFPRIGNQAKPEILGAVAQATVNVSDYSTPNAYSSSERHVNYRGPSSRKSLVCLIRRCHKM